MLTHQLVLVMENYRELILAGHPSFLDKKYTFIAGFVSNLKAGTGEPWAGQLRLSGRPDSFSNMEPLLSWLNFGAEPPTGSVNQTWITHL